MDSNIKIKLCGLSRATEIELANQLLPDYIGFVFAPKSRRYVSFEQARLLRAKLSDKIQAVGVFVREPVEMVADLLNRGIIDLAQLHGNEDEEYIRELRKRTSGKLIKAFSVSSEQVLAEADSCSADYLLFDSGKGGTGTHFDWRLLREYKKPYFLAGGLDPDNVEAAIALLQPYAVDVSSGIETSGLKDPEKMRRFVSKVRGYGS